VGDNIQHVRVQRKRWYDDALFKDESTPPDDAPAWTISSSYNRDGGGGSGRQNEREGGRSGGIGNINQNEGEGGGGSGGNRRRSSIGDFINQNEEEGVGGSGGNRRRSSNQNEEEGGGGSGGSRVLVEGGGRTEEQRRDKGKGTDRTDKRTSIDDLLNH
jgi:hypothetical protein